MYSNLAISIGIKKEDFLNLDKIMKEFGFFKFICIDVANGYSEHFTSFIKSVRDKYPTKTIIAGNVVTADMTKASVSGADIVSRYRTRKCLYNKNSNRGWISSIKCCNWMCWCCSWLGCAYNCRWWVHLSRWCCKRFWWWIL